MEHPILLYILGEILEVIRHWFRIERQHKSPNKVLSFCARALVMGLCVYVYEWRLPVIERDMYVVIPAYIMTGWVWHDYFLNLIRGVKPIWKLNNTGPIDKFQNKYLGSDIWFIWKMLVALTLDAMYFFNY